MTFFSVVTLQQFFLSSSLNGPLYLALRVALLPTYKAMGPFHPLMGPFTPISSEGGIGDGLRRLCKSVLENRYSRLDFNVESDVMQGSGLEFGVSKSFLSPLFAIRQLCLC